MAKLQGNYELIVVLSNKLGEDGINSIKDKVNTLLSDAVDLNVDEWGKRRLAYPINYETDGFYLLYTFSAAPTLPAEIERVLNITEGVLRFLVIAKNN